MKTEEKIEALVTRLFELGQTINTHHGYPAPVLHPGATETEIKDAERIFGKSFPPSYVSFLRLHNGFERFWGDFWLVGASGPHSRRAFDFIRVLIAIDTEARKLLDEQAIQKFEKSGGFYLPNHLIFGPNFSRAAFLYDRKSLRKDGEMDVVHWAQDASRCPRYPSFVAMLEAAVKDREGELSKLK